MRASAARHRLSLLGMVQRPWQSGLAMRTLVGDAVGSPWGLQYLRLAPSARIDF
jgi:hypothetical protein